MHKKKRKNDMKKNVLFEILDWSRVILTALAIAFIANHTLIANAQIPTGSMENTIMPGSRVIINRLAYVKEEPKRGDIISFYFPDDGETLFIKRIIELPGETVWGKDGNVYIDGRVLEEGYLKEGIHGG